MFWTGQDSTTEFTLTDLNKRRFITDVSYKIPEKAREASLVEHPLGTRYWPKLQSYNNGQDKVLAELQVFEEK